MELVAATEPDREVKVKETTREILGNRLVDKVVTSLPDSKTNPSKDVSVYLSKKLDNKNFNDGFSFIWMIWTEKPHIQVKGWSWLFKVFLWCLRSVELS